MQWKELFYDIQQVIIAFIFAIGILGLGYGIGLLFGISNTINLITDPYQLNITYDSMTKTESNILLLNVFVQFITGIYYMLSGFILMLISIIIDSNKPFKRR